MNVRGEYKMEKTQCLAKSLADFIEDNGLKKEALDYVATCDRKELEDYFNR